MEDKNIKKKLKGTETEKNLWTAFSGECEALNTIFLVTNDHNTFKLSFSKNNRNIDIIVFFIIYYFTINLS